MYRVLLRARAVKDLSNLAKEYAQRVAQHIDALAEAPRPPDAKKLKQVGGYSLRVGVYRVLYDIDDAAQTVTIYRVKHRRDAYR